MNLIIDNAKQREVIIRSALLTTGSGPIVNSAYKALLQYTDLRGVIFSKNKKIAPRWKELNKYGVWYTLQYVTSRNLYIISGNTNMSRLLPTEIGVRMWESQQDQDDLIEWLKNLNIDLVIVCRFQYILTRDFFTTFRYCVNIHPSLLPSYRGPEPVIWGLLDKNSIFGITLHLIDEGIDTGDIICQREIEKPILPLSFIIEMKLAKVLPDLIKHTIEQIQADKLHTCKQEAGFYLSLPTLANRKIRKQKDCRTSP